MAKTLAQIQAMITAKYDAREIINELADFLETFSPSPGGDGMTLESYQNSAMSAAVMAYVFKDENDNIFRVYEPERNNDVSRKTFAYADSIDKVPFDNTDWFNNTIVDVKLIDVAADVKINGCTFETMVINGNSSTGLEFINHVQKGLYGANCPNDAEIVVSGNNVKFNGNVIDLSRNTDDVFPTFIDSIGADSKVIGCTFGGGCYFDIQSNKISLIDCIFGIFTELDVAAPNSILTDVIVEDAGFITLNRACTLFDINIKNNGGLTINSNCAHIQFAEIGLRARVTASENIDNSSFGLKSIITNTGGALDGVTFGDNITVETREAISNKKFINVGGNPYEQRATLVAGVLTQTLFGYFMFNAPASLTPTVISDTEIDLVWDAVADATNYILEAGLQADYSDAAQIYSGSNLTFNNTGLTAATQYFYRVKAQNANYLDSDWTIADATTNA